MREKPTREEWEEIERRDYGRQKVSKSALSAGLSGFITVPRDPRTGGAMVNSYMKQLCIGEFKFGRENSYINDDGKYIDSWEDVEVPWTTVKEIYKAMVAAAERTAT